MPECLMLGVASQNRRGRNEARHLVAAPDGGVGVGVVVLVAGDVEDGGEGVGPGEQHDGHLQEERREGAHQGHVVPHRPPEGRPERERHLIPEQEYVT